MFHKLVVVFFFLGLYGELPTAFPEEKTISAEQDVSDYSEPQQCAPGYWCKKKRDADGIDCPRGYTCRSKRDEAGPDVCAPGYWCRRSELVIDRETRQEDCPKGSWCKQGRGMVTRTRSFVRSPGDLCPPGYWCRKKRSIAALLKKQDSKKRQNK